VSDLEDYTDIAPKVLTIVAIAIVSLIFIALVCGAVTASIRAEASDQTHLSRPNRGDIEMNLEPPIRISEDAIKSIKEPPPTYQAAVGMN
jgi:hypothetical protein